MLKNTKAIYFDLDNTIIDRDKAFWLCIKEFFLTFLPKIDVEKEKNLILKKDNFGYNSRVEFSKWFVFHYKPKNISETDFLNFQIKNIANHVSHSSNELIQLFKNLQTIYKIGILTNGSIENQMKKIKNAGLDRVFQKEIYISEQYKISKPDKEIFEILIKNLNLKPSEILYVGDNPLNDIFGAKQVGIKTCWLSNERKWNESFMFDIEINNLIELKNLIKTNL